MKRFLESRSRKDRIGMTHLSVYSYGWRVLRSIRFIPMAEFSGQSCTIGLHWRLAADRRFELPVKLVNVIVCVGLVPVLKLIGIAEARSARYLAYFAPGIDI